MRLNKYIAAATGLSRRVADQAIAENRVTVNAEPAHTGQDVNDADTVMLDGHALRLEPISTTILLNKPEGYVVSRNGQGSKTIYDLLPPELHHLKPIGRLDKNSSGLLLLTNDGDLANELTHPRFAKTKVYEVELDKPLAAHDKERITGPGVQLEDGPSRFQLEPLVGGGQSWKITMQEGRNRQIRRTFAALGYAVKKLHRMQFGPYRLDESIYSAGSYHSIISAGQAGNR